MGAVGAVGAFLVCCAARFLLAVGRGVLRRQNNVSARCLFAVGRSGRYVYACGMPADKFSYAFDLLRGGHSGNLFCAAFIVWLEQA